MDALKEWTIAFVKNKDAASRKLIKYDDKGSFIDFHFKDKTNRHYISEHLDGAIISQLDKTPHKTIVCPNTEENFAFLIKHWKQFLTVNNLTMIFVNLETQEKWTINPKIHAMIADPESIETGLRTMFDTANGKIAEVPKGKKKSQMFEESSNKDDEDENSGEEDDAGN